MAGAVGAAGAASVNPNQHAAAKNNAQALQSANEALKADIANLTEEVTSFAAATKTGKEGKEAQQLSTRIQTQQAGKPQFNHGQVSPEEMAAAFAAAVSEEDEVTKSKRKQKEKELEQKMARLAELEGQFDLSQLNAEEREVVEQFYQNMSQIRQSKGQLRRLDEEEEYLKTRIKQEEARKKREQTHQRQGPVRNEEQKNG